MSGAMIDDSPLEEQIDYYRARVPEYDDWFYRRGRYDRGSEANRAWRDEGAEVRRALEARAPFGRVLELASGTGIWTEALLPGATEMTAVDGVPEMIEACRRRLPNAPIRYIETDLFSFALDRTYDFVFFAFWLSHVPEERFRSFWDHVGRSLAPGGSVFLVDSLFDRTSTARDHRLESPEETTVLRRLNDGREYRIVKIFYEAESLGRKLGDLGWKADLRQTAHYSVYGEARYDP